MQCRNDTDEKYKRKRNFSPKSALSPTSPEHTQLYNIAIEEHEKCTDQHRNSQGSKTKNPINLKYRCEMCDKTFLYDEYLQLHTRNVHNFTLQGIELKCELCGKVFPTGKHFKEHSILHENEKLLSSTNNIEVSSKIVPAFEDISANSDKVFNCEGVAEISTIANTKQRNKQLSTIQTGHKLNLKIPHTGDIFCQCIHCKTNFMSGTLSDTTIQTEHWNNNKKPRKPRPTCEICKASFTTNQSLNTHMENKHGEKKHVCKICCKAFNSQYLKLHMKTKHSSVKQMFNCGKCDKTFSFKNSLKNHDKLYHRNVKSFRCSVPCDVCGKELANKKSLLRHRQKVHTAEDKLTCAHCNLKFKDKWSILIHMKVMHLPPTVKCHMCDILLPTNFYLKKHLLVQHSIGKVKSFMCEICGRVYHHRFNFEYHLQTSHLTKCKMFKCNHCEKSFYTKHHLTQHSLVHSDARKFNCDLCEKSFKLKHHLKQHISVHGLGSIPNYRKKQKDRLTTSKFVSDETDCESSN